MPAGIANSVAGNHSFGAKRPRYAKSKYAQRWPCVASAAITAERFASFRSTIVVLWYTPTPPEISGHFSDSL